MSQYYDSIAVSSEWLETYKINPFENSEAFLVNLLIEYSYMILNDIISKVIEILKRLSERDLYQIIDGYM